MNSKRFLLTPFLIGLLGSIAYAQVPIARPADKVAITWGPGLDWKVEGTFQETIGMHDEAFLYTTKVKKDLLLNRIGLDLHPLGRNAVPMKVGGQEHQLQGIWLVEDQVHVVTSTFEKSTSTTELYVRSYGAYDLGGGAMRKLHAIEEINKRERAKLTFSYTPGSGFMLFIWHKLESSDSTQEAEEVYFDSAFQPVGDKALRRQMPFPAQEFVVVGSMVDQDGSAVSIGRRYPDKAVWQAMLKEGKTQFSTVLVHFPAGSTTGEVMPLELGEKFIQDIRMVGPQDPPPRSSWLACTAIGMPQAPRERS